MLYIFSIFLGWYADLSHPALTQVFMEALKRSFITAYEVEALGLAFFIMLNNSIKCLVAMVLGLLFGFIPLIFVVLNGFILGIVSMSVAKVKGWLFVLMATVPHGFLEIPAMLISVAVGFREGWALINKLAGKNIEVGKEVVFGLNIYLRAVLPLIVVAAFIEAFVTPLLIEVVS